MGGRKSKKRQMNEAIGKAGLLRREKDKKHFSFRSIVKPSVSGKQTTVDFGQSKVAQERKRKKKRCNN